MYIIFNGFHTRAVKVQLHLALHLSSHRKEVLNSTLYEANNCLYYSQANSSYLIWYMVKSDITIDCANTTLIAVEN